MRIIIWLYEFLIVWLTSNVVCWICGCLRVLIRLIYVTIIQFWWHICLHIHNYVLYHHENWLLRFIYTCLYKCTLFAFVWYRDDKYNYAKLTLVNFSYLFVSYLDSMIIIIQNNIQNLCLLIHTHFFVNNYCDSLNLYIVE